MIFNVGPGELFVIGIILLVVVGPEQLPSVARNAGRTLRRVRDMSQALRADFMASIEEPIVPDKPNSSTESKEPPTFLDKQVAANSDADVVKVEIADSDENPAEETSASSDENELVEDKGPEPPTDGLLP